MLHRNIKLKLLALVLALCLWAYVTVNEQVGEKAFSVAIDVARTPSNLAVTSETGNAVVWLRGERETLETAANQVHARALLSTHEPGKVTARIDPLFPQGLTLVKVVPTQITLQLEEVIKKRFPATCELQGQPSPGYVLGQPRVHPAYVEVSGAESTLAKVNRVVVRIDTSFAMLGQPQSGPLEPVDAAGRKVSGLKVEPQMATVTVPVRSSIASKLLPVFVSFSGTPPEGFQVGRTSVSPPLVTAAGEASAVKALEAISTLPLSLDLATSSITRRIALVVPEGVASLSERNVLVRVEIVAEAYPEHRPEEVTPPPSGQE
ncbi:MAG: hypothetical protein GTO55_05830 [Armatimonadetes bacterium]|nr:hypothetical protein [Armatimonadota bacterium]NIM23773.1 hypothetical protein [Armatimonadota bacterium]NIM67650.1 hypothetical protein [Armatimonadota bacterium]NIM76166.1 hypothetical protein [Armatimonadota bacterium]NIN05851.1 hypothetical protein [Armatimonadota bacterium]